jgi:hypothetical protein
VRLIHDEQRHVGPWPAGQHAARHGATSDHRDRAGHQKREDPHDWPDARRARGKYALVASKGGAQSTRSGTTTSWPEPVGAHGHAGGGSRARCLALFGRRDIRHGRGTTRRWRIQPRAETSRSRPQLHQLQRQCVVSWVAECPLRRCASFLAVVAVNECLGGGGGGVQACKATCCLRKSHGATLAAIVLRSITSKPLPSGSILASGVKLYATAMAVASSWPRRLARNAARLLTSTDSANSEPRQPSMSPTPPTRCYLSWTHGPPACRSAHRRGEAGADSKRAVTMRHRRRIRLGTRGVLQMRASSHTWRRSASSPTPCDRLCRLPWAPAIPPPRAQ